MEINNLFLLAVGVLMFSNMVIALWNGIRTNNPWYFEIAIFAIIGVMVVYIQLVEVSATNLMGIRVLILVILSAVTVYNLNKMGNG